MPPLRVLLLSDGRPGHYHLSDGIVAAAARLRPIAVTRLEVRRKRWPGAVLAALVNGGAPPRWLLKTVYRLDVAALPPADLVVSAGAETLAANIAAAQLLSAHNVFYGSLRKFRPMSFSLVLTSYAERGRLSRHRMTLKPSSLDPDNLGRPLSAAILGLDRPPRIAGALIGGDSGTFSYQPGDWQCLVEFLAAAHRQLGTRWLVSNSRRTDARVSDHLGELASQPGAPILEFVDVRTAGPGTLRGIFERAEAILATDDSSSMVSEAIWARLPVLGVTPERHAFTADERAYRAYLIGQDWCRSLPLAELTPDVFLAALGEVKPLQDNPLDRLAGLLAEELPSLFPRTVHGNS